MAIQIILLLIAIPIIAAYFNIAYRRWQHHFEVWWATFYVYVLMRFPGSIAPKTIKNEIKIRRDIIAENKYQAERLPALKRTMSAPFSGAGESKDATTWALAERLTHTKHVNHWGFSKLWNPENLKRPPMWIRYIIAQIIR